MNLGLQIGGACGNKRKKLILLSLIVELTQCHVFYIVNFSKLVTNTILFKIKYLYHFSVELKNYSDFLKHYFNFLFLNSLLIKYY